MIRTGLKKCYIEFKNSNKIYLQALTRNVIVQMANFDTKRTNPDPTTILNCYFIYPRFGRENSRSDWKRLLCMKICCGSHKTNTFNPVRTQTFYDPVERVKSLSRVLQMCRVPGFVQCSSLDSDYVRLHFTT